MVFLTAGESHGPGLVGIIEGLPSGIKIDCVKINKDLEQRQVRYGRGTRMKIEKDKVMIISGAIDGRTYGAPLCMMIVNKDDRNLFENSGEPEKIPRPGHVDLAGSMKYGLKDLKMAAERAGGRNTAIYVAMGSFARNVLQEFNIEVLGFIISLGGIDAEVPEESIKEIRSSVENSFLRCPDTAVEKKMMAKIDKCSDNGDSLGGIIQVICDGVPVGLGSFAHWDRRLDGRLAQALMSIPGIKGVEIGEGFSITHFTGSKAHDEIYWEGRYKRKTNLAGGIEGGVSNGEKIILKGAMKPIPTLKKGLSSVDITTKEKATAQYVRSDVCAVPAVSVVAEAMVSIIILDAFLEKFQADSLEEIKKNYRNYLKASDRF